MSNYILSIFPIIVIIVTFWKATVSKNGSFNEIMWSPSQTDVLRAMAIMCIVLHHISQDVAGYDSYSMGPISFLSNMGYLFTAVFFFISGYGILVNFKTRSGYLKGFLFHRLSSVLIPFWIANIINILVGILYLRREYTSLDVLKYVSGILLINSQGWFVIEIIALYIAFYFIFRYVKNQKLSLIILGFFCILLIVYSKSLGHDETGGNRHWFMGEWWYNTTICFWFGAVAGSFKENITGFIKKYYSAVLCISTICLIGACILAEKVRLHYGYYEVKYLFNGFQGSTATLICQSLASILFVGFLFVINAKVTLGSRLANRISVISFEIYLIHGLFVKDVFDFKNVPNFYRYVIVIASSLFAAVLLYKLDSLILKGVKCLKKSILSKIPKKIESRDIRKRQRVLYIKVLISVCICLGILLLGYWLYVTYYVIPKEYEEECEHLSNAMPSDRVYFGKYGNEKVSWIVLQRDGDTLMLISEYGIDGAVYYDNHMPVTWKDSALRDILNNNIYYDMFNDSERQHILKVNQDFVTLLTAAEAERYFDTDLDRQLVITNYARLMGTNLNNASKVNQWDYEPVKTSWWWLRQDEGVESITAPIVTVDGEILMDIKYVNKPNGALRPVIWVGII